LVFINIIKYNKINYLLFLNSDSIKGSYRSNILLSERNSLDINSNVDPTEKELYHDNTSISSFDSEPFKSVNEKVDEKDKDVNPFTKSDDSTDIKDSKELNTSLSKANQKELIREFTKLFLKTKFEMINSLHSGQTVEPKLIWKKIVKEGITKNKWKEFICDELKNPNNFPATLKTKKSLKKMNNSR